LRRRFYLSCLSLHFALIIAVCCNTTLSNLARGLTWLPPSLDKYWQKAEQATGYAIGTSEADNNPFRRIVTFYVYSAGVEGGYGFFAPNVPSSSKLVFELRYPDGRTEYDLPRVNDPEAGLRLISLLDYIGQTDYEPLRQAIVKMLAYSAWHKHPDAVEIRAVYGVVNEPALAEAERGAKESYHFLYAYDFNFRAEPTASPNP
jgi:hypothetical protein